MPDTTTNKNEKEEVRRKGLSNAKKYKEKKGK